MTRRPGAIPNTALTRRVRPSITTEQVAARFLRLLADGLDEGVRAQRGGTP